MKKEKSLTRRKGEPYPLEIIFFIKFMCFFQMTLLKYTGIGIIEKFISKKVSYHIITGIAQHS